MASLLKNDEINKLQDYEEYFDVMNISKEQKLERIELAELLEDVFLFLFVYADAYIQTSAFDIEDLYEIGERRYIDALEEYGIDFEKHPSVKEYASRMVRDILDSSVNNKVKSTDDSQNSYKSTAIESANNVTDKTTSGNANSSNSKNVEEHAINVAKNEANTVLNMVDYDDAIANGYTSKTWLTENDDKVRYTHRSVDGQTIPIDGIFLVGDSEMRFPRDYGLGASPSEVVGCRCSLKFERQDNSSTLLKNSTNYDNVYKKRNVYSFGKRNEKPLTQEQIQNAINLAYKQGYSGDIQYSEYINTGFGGSAKDITKENSFHHLIIGTDVYPSDDPNETSANSRISLEACIAHEVVGHYMTWVKGTDLEDTILDEAQASIRASRFGIDLTDVDREMLMQDALDRLKSGGYSFENVKDILDIEEK